MNENIMRGDEEGGASDAVAPTSSSNNSNALNALTLQAIKDQQLIIERQRELVAALKARVAELETQQAPCGGSPSIPSTQLSSSTTTKAYAADVHLRRRLAAAEKECATQKAEVAQLRDDVRATSEHLAAQRLLQHQQEVEWAARVAAATSKADSATQLLDVIDQRNVRLTDQAEKLRRAVDVRVYEVAQWRSLVTTVLSRLDGPNSRYAREQMSLIEEYVQRYAARHTAAAGASTTGAGPDGGGTPDGGEGEDAANSRSVWSRTAQSMLSSTRTTNTAEATASAPRFRTTMNAGDDRRSGGVEGVLPTKAGARSQRVEAAHASMHAAGDCAVRLSASRGGEESDGSGVARRAAASLPAVYNRLALSSPVFPVSRSAGPRSSS